MPRDDYGPNRELSDSEFAELLEHVQFALGLVNIPADRRLIIQTGDVLRQQLLRRLRIGVETTMRGLTGFITETKREKEKTLRALRKREQSALLIRTRFTDANKDAFHEMLFCEKLKELSEPSLQVIEDFHRDVRSISQNCEGKLISLLEQLKLKLQDSIISNEDDLQNRLAQHEHSLVQQSLDQIVEIAKSSLRSLSLQLPAIEGQWVIGLQNLESGAAAFCLAPRQPGEGFDDE